MTAEPTLPKTLSKSKTPYSYGTVRWFSVAKGYGFISPLSNGPGDPQDVFVHHTALSGESVQTGDRVRFQLVVGDKGPRAKCVERA